MSFRSSRLRPMLIHRGENNYFYQEQECRNLQNLHRSYCSSNKTSRHQRAKTQLDFIKKQRLSSINNCIVILKLLFSMLLLSQPNPNMHVIAVQSRLHRRTAEHVHTNTSLVIYMFLCFYVKEMEQEDLCQ